MRRRRVRVEASASGPRGLGASASRRGGVEPLSVKASAREGARADWGKLKHEVDKRGGEFEAKWGESISQRTGAAARLKNERASGANMGQERL